MSCSGTDLMHSQTNYILSVSRHFLKFQGTSEFPLITREYSTPLSTHLPPSLSSLSSIHTTTSLGPGASPYPLNSSSTSPFFNTDTYSFKKPVSRKASDILNTSNSSPLTGTTKPSISSQSSPEVFHSDPTTNANLFTSSYPLYSPSTLHNSSSMASSTRNLPPKTSLSSSYYLTSTPTLTPSSASPPAAPSTTYSSPLSSSSVCWFGGHRGVISFTSDYEGNIWALNTISDSSYITPSNVWVLNFTSLSWQELGYFKTKGIVEPEKASTTDTSHSSTESDTKQSNKKRPKDILEPVAFCSWSKGLVTIYTYNSSSYIWLFTYKNGRWVKLSQFKDQMFPAGVHSVHASWCGKRQDVLWLLTSIEKATQPTNESYSNRSLERQHVLWKLDHQGKWTAIELTGDNIDVSLLKYVKTWIDSRGDLFILQKIISKNVVNIIKLDLKMKVRTKISVKHNRNEVLLIPSTTGHLYSLFSNVNGNWIKTINYYTGEITSVESISIPEYTENAFIRINNTVYNNIPNCDHEMGIPKPIVSDQEKYFIMYDIFHKSECERGERASGTQRGAENEVIILQQAKKPLPESEWKATHRSTIPRSVTEDAYVDTQKKTQIEQEAEVIFPKLSPSGDEEQDFSRASSVGDKIFISDREEVKTGPEI
ncbi:hypothetical protein SK128_004215 [Halocaridina rubra]|uniref:Uncharacterized protein n=1 Tax=Halocaridina rubra TaxID=373956 RepID=A0AAN8XC93_HALRR